MVEYQVTEYKNDKCVVRVHKPILTVEEKKAREDEIKNALVKWAKERMKNNGYKNQQACVAEF